MKKTILFSVLSVMLLSAINSGCGKKVEKGNKDFIGVWQYYDGTYTYTVNIKGNEEDYYSKCTGILTCTTNTGTARIKGSTLNIGGKKLTIDEAPSNASGIWITKLDGLVYTKL